MKELVVLVPFANDATNCSANARHIDIGPNMKSRLEVAHRWANENVSGDEVVWAFGAGSRADMRNGDTLATLAAKYIEELDSRQLISYNSFDHHYYGTLEELEWIRERISTRYPGRQIRFVFFNQPRSMTRTKLLWCMLLRPKNWSGEFVAVSQVTDDVSPLGHEFIAILKALGVRVGLLKGRHQKN